MALPNNLEVVLNQLEGGIAKAFRRGVQDIKDSAVLAALESAIARRDVNLVLSALDIEPAFFSELDRAIDIAYHEWATSEGSLINQQLGAAATFRFDGRHRRAELWTQQHGGELVTKVTTDTREVIRYFVRQGLENGQGPRDIALNLIGRSYGAGQPREGGVIGLTPAQASYVFNMRAELADPRGMANYFNRNARDRRFDSQVQKAIDAGKPVPQNVIDRITDKYADNLLVLRGETIARTEALAAYNAGRWESTQQLIDSGKVPRSAVTLIWDATLSKRTRDSHLMLNGVEIPFGGLFQSPVTGGLLRFPGDTGVGAPGSETINCRCTMRTRIDRKQLATNKPRGRPPGSRNAPKDPAPPPEPPQPPPEPPVAPLLPPAPAFPYEALQPATSKAALMAMAAPYAGEFRQPTGATIAQASRMVTRVAEVTERFGLTPLNTLGFTPPRGRRPKGALGVCWMGLGGVHFMATLYDTKAMQKHISGAQWHRESKTVAHVNKVAVEGKIPLSTVPASEEVRERVKRIPGYDWTVRTEEDWTPERYEDQVTYHEMGHYLHSQFRSELDYMIQPFWKEWSVLVSKYGGSNALEYIAETFSLYMLGDESQFFRIHPNLLNWYRAHDRKVNGNGQP